MQPARIAKPDLLIQIKATRQSGIRFDLNCRLPWSTFDMSRNLQEIQAIVDAIKPLIRAANVEDRLAVLSVQLADRLIGDNWLDEPQRRQRAMGEWATQLYPTLDDVERANGSRLNLKSASDWLASTLRSTFEDLKSPDFRRSNFG